MKADGGQALLEGSLCSADFHTIFAGYQSQAGAFYHLHSRSHERLIMASNR